MTFDSETCTARTLVRLVTLSVELFEDADPSSEDVIARAFASQLALELASLLIASGADVKVVQTRMRHASGKVTLDDVLATCGRTPTTAHGPPSTRSWRPALQVLRTFCGLREGVRRDLSLVRGCTWGYTS